MGSTVPPRLPAFKYGGDNLAVSSTVRGVVDFAKRIRRLAGCGSARSPLNA
jgi:hypothetical protein